MKKIILILFVSSLSMSGVLAGKLYDSNGKLQTLKERRASEEAKMWECLTIIGVPMAIFAIWFFREQTKK
jgi:hypothetical protein